MSCWASEILRKQEWEKHFGFKTTAIGLLISQTLRVLLREEATHHRDKNVTALSFTFLSLTFNVLSKCRFMYLFCACQLLLNFLFVNKRKWILICGPNGRDSEDVSDLEWIIFRIYMHVKLDCETHMHISRLHMSSGCWHCNVSHCFETTGSVFGCQRLGLFGAIGNNNWRRKWSRRVLLETILDKNIYLWGLMSAISWKYFLKHNQHTVWY